MFPKQINRHAFFDTLTFAVASLFLFSASATFAQSYEDIYIVRPDGRSALRYFSMRRADGNIALFLKDRDELKGFQYIFPSDYEVSDHNGRLAAGFPEPGFATISNWPVSIEGNNFTLECDNNSWTPGSFTRGAVVVVLPADFELTSRNANVAGEWKLENNVLSFFIAKKNNIKPAIIFKKKQAAITRDSIVEHYAALATKYSSLNVNCDDLMNSYRVLQSESDSLLRANSELEAARKRAVALFNAVRSPDVDVSSSNAGVRLGLSERILFASGQADVTASGIAVLRQIADRVKQGDRFKLLITGYTDNVPLAKQSRYASNWQLSAARAASIAQLLFESGIAENSIEVHAKGAADPIADNSTEPGRAKNRRIEIEYVAY